MDEPMNADDIEAIDAADVDWKGTAENLQAELNRLQRQALAEAERFAADARASRDVDNDFVRGQAQGHADAEAAFLSLAGK